MDSVEHTRSQHWINKDFTHVAAILVYLLAFSWQLNWYPGERYPEWDNQWGDVRAIGRIETVARALRNLEVPAIDPYMCFGMHRTGDLFCPLGPMYFLGLLMDARAVIWLGQFILMALAGIGSYYYLKRFCNDKFVALLGGLTLVSTWANVGGSVYYMHHGTFWIIYFLPVALILIHRVLEQPTASRLAVFALYFAIAYTSVDAFCMIVFPWVVLAYTLFSAWLFHAYGFLSSLKKALLLLVLSLLGGSVYLVPMFINCEAIASNLELMRQAIGTPREGAWIWQHRILGGIWGPIIQPTENPYNGAVYVPVAYYLLILMALVCSVTFFREKMRQVALVLVVLLIYPLLFGVTILNWSPASKILYSFSETSHNIVGVPFNLNVLPYVVVLAAFICIGAIVRSGNWKLKALVYGLVIVVALVRDLSLFGGSDITIPPFESSNRIRLPIENSLGALPWLNLLPLLLLIIYDFAGRVRWSAPRPALYPVFLIFAIVLPLLKITIYNDWSVRCGAGGRLVTRHPYRQDNHLLREAAIDKIIDRSDPNFRYLYAGTETPHSRDDGRAMKALAARELHVLAPYKMLFSRRNFTDPYEGLMWGLSVGGHFRPWQLNPPMSREVHDSIEQCKRMFGIKYVMSMHERIDSPHLIYRGRCDTPKMPNHFFNPPAAEFMPYWTEAKPIFIYEVADPTGIAFLVDEYKKVDVSESLRTIYENSAQPWNNDLVYLETDPDSVSLSEVGPLPNKGQPATAAIVRETYTSMDVEVSTPTGKYLVLSYLYRPYWKAFIGQTELPIYRAYGGFMCVKVPPGAHAVKFQYYSYEVYLGILLTALALVVPIGLKRIF